MITINRTVNLNQLCRVENLSGVVFTGEQGGHEFILTAIKNEAVMPLTGSVSGQVRCPDGTPVQLTTTYCDIDEYGRGVVKLAGNCYEHGSGPFGLIVTNVDGDGNRTVIYAAAGFIHVGEAASPVDPESTINVAAIQAIISDMEDAIEDCENAAAFVPNLIAAEYNYQSTYGVGDYCTHDGKLYRCIIPITTAGSGWGNVSGNFQQVNVAGEMFGLTNAFNEMYAADITNTNEWTVGTLKPADGTTNTSSTRLRMNNFVNAEDEVFRVKAKDGYEFMVYAWNKTSGNYIGCLKTGGVFNTETSGFLWLKEYNIANQPGLKYKMVLRNAVTTSATMTLADAANCLYTTRYMNDDTVAPEFDETASYAENDYALYDTELYRFTAAHSGAWTGTDAEKVSATGEVMRVGGNIMAEVDDMNTSIARGETDGFDASKFDIGLEIRPNGTNKGANDKRARTGYIKITKPFVIVPSAVYKILVCVFTGQSAGSFVRNLTGSAYTANPVVVPTTGGIEYIRIGVARTDNADMTDADQAGIAAGLTVYEYTDTTLSVPSASADAKATGDRIAAIEAIDAGNRLDSLESEATDADSRLDSLEEDVADYDNRLETVENGEIAGIDLPDIFDSTGSILPEIGLNEEANANDSCSMWQSVAVGTGKARIGPIIDMGSMAGRVYTGRRVYKVFAYNESGARVATAQDSYTSILHTFTISTPHRYIRVSTLSQYRYEYDLVVGETIGASTHRGIVQNGVNREGVITKRTFLRLGSLEPAATYQKYRMAFCEYTNNGVLLLGGESRYNNGNDNNDISIVFRRSFDNGRTFTAPIILFERNVDSDISYHAKGSGQFLVDRNTGRVFCFCMREDSNIDRVHGGLASKAEYDSSILYKFSDDDGATWSEENSIDLRTSEMMFMASAPSQGITMSDGTLVVPAFCKYAADGSYRSLLIYSTDHGENWTWSGVTVPESSNECTVVETNTPGTLMINCRDEAAPYRVVYTTSDLGATWTEHITNRYSLYNFKVEGHLKKVTLGGGNGSTVYLFSAPFGPIISNNAKTVTKIMCSYDLISWSEFCLVTTDGSRGYTMMAVYGDILNIVEEFGDERLVCGTMHINQATIKATPLMVPVETEQLRRGQLYYDKTANKLKFVDASGTTQTISFES